MKTVAHILLALLLSALQGALLRWLGGGAFSLMLPMACVVYLAVHAGNVEGSVGAAGVGYVLDVTLGGPKGLLTFLAVVVFLIVRAVHAAVDVRGRWGFAVLAALGTLIASAGAVVMLRVIAQPELALGLGVVPRLLVEAALTGAAAPLVLVGSLAVGSLVGEAIGRADMFSGEKLSPVLTLWKFDAFEEAIRLVRDITRYSGYGHSCGLHSTNDEHMLALATQTRVSRMMVRQTQPYGNSGNYDNGMPFALTLGCGTWGGNITSENVHWKHFINTTWVSVPIEPVVPDENVIFGEYWNKFGK